MKRLTTQSFVAAAVLALCCVSCKKESQTDATQPLQQSFEAAEPEVKTAIDTVTTNLKAQNYAEATRALAPVITRPLTDQQRQAVGVALNQINEAVAANPALDTKEMYEMRAKMFKAVHSGPRF
jgi:C4-dicarboxylate-specific signal transduction histidine kinase